MTKTTKRKGLGRGLDALLNAGGGQSRALEAAENAMNLNSSTGSDLDHSNGQFKEIPVEYLQRGKYQPRRDMHQEALQELAESIKAQGVMQPIVVRSIGENKYEIIAGERRWRATQLAGLDKVPAIIKDVSDEAAIAMALIENIQREDLNPVEEAVALKRLQDEFELTHQEVADAVGKSRTAVSNILRLLSLCSDVRLMLEHGDIEMGHARCLLTLDAEDQKNLARQIVAKGMSVRQAENLVRSLQEQKEKPEKPAKISADLERLQDGLSEHVGVPVSVQHTAKGSGKLIFKYSNLDELDGILHHLKYES